MQSRWPWCLNRTKPLICVSTRESSIEPTSIYDYAPRLFQCQTCFIYTDITPSGVLTPLPGEWPSSSVTPLCCFNRATTVAQDQFHSSRLRFIDNQTISIPEFSYRVSVWGIYLSVGRLGGIAYGGFIRPNERCGLPLHTPILRGEPYEASHRGLLTFYFAQPEPD